MHPFANVHGFAYIYAYAYGLCVCMCVCISVHQRAKHAGMRCKNRGHRLSLENKFNMSQVPYAPCRNKAEEIQEECDMLACTNVESAVTRES